MEDGEKHEPEPEPEPELDADVGVILLRARDDPLPFRLPLPPLVGSPLMALRIGGTGMALWSALLTLCIAAAGSAGRDSGEECCDGDDDMDLSLERGDAVVAADVGVEGEYVRGELTLG